MSTTKYTLVPIIKNSPLQTIHLKNGSNTIGRMPSQGVSIVLSEYGVPKNLVKFISRRHAEIVISGNNISLKPLTSLQASNKVMRLNDADCLQHGVVTKCKEGDKLTFLHGAGKTFQDTFAGDLEYVIAKEISAGGRTEGSVEDGLWFDTQGSPSKRKRTSITSSVATQGMETEIGDKIESSSSSSSSSSGAGGGGGGGSGLDSIEVRTNNSNAAVETLSCAICMGVILDAWTINCSGWHNFCKECITDWLKHDPTCPNCQEEVQLAKSHPNLLADQTIMLMFEIGVIIGDEKEEFKKRRSELYPDRPPLASPLKRTGTLTSSQRSKLRKTPTKAASSSSSPGRTLVMPREVLEVEDMDDVVVKQQSTILSNISGRRSSSNNNNNNNNAPPDDAEIIEIF